MPRRRLGRSGRNLHTRRPTQSDRNDPDSGETDVASVGQASGRLKSYASELTRIKNRRSILPVRFRSRASWTRDHFLGTANIWSIMDLTDLRRNKVQRYLPTSEINIALWPTHRAVKAYL